MENNATTNPSALDRILDTASKLGLGYLDYRIASDQREAAAALQYQQTSGAQNVDNISTWGLGGSVTGPLGLPNWVMPVALLGFGAVVAYKAIAK